MTFEIPYFTYRIMPRALDMYIDEVHNNVLKWEDYEETEFFEIITKLGTRSEVYFNGI